MPEDKVKKNKRNQKWKDQNRDRINLLFRLGTKEKIDHAAAAAGLSKSQYVQLAIDNQLARDRAADPQPPGLIDNIIQWLQDHGHGPDDISEIMEILTGPE